MMIPRRNYFSSEPLTEELTRLFQPAWHFAAMADELSSDRDYVCVDRLDSAVVLQNFRGETRAFENVCSHRFNRIQPRDRGNRPLICAYHGWNFDADGHPHGMPRRDTFAHVEPQSICLERFAVDRCGPFIFYRRGGDGPDLRSYLGRFYDVLEQIGACIGAEIDNGVIQHEANWKLLVENVLECYHCSVVHQQTFVKTLGLGKAGITDAFFDGPHSSSHFPRTQIGSEERRKKALAYLDRRAFVHDSFFHIYIFPNLFISSTQGLSFYVGQALPLAAARTNLRFRLFEPKLELTRAQRAAQDMVNGSGKALGRAVIEEDRAILEQIQRGIAIGSKAGVIGTEEVRISAFMNAYEHLMDGGSLCGIPPIDDQASAGYPAGRVA